MRNTVILLVSLIALSIPSTANTVYSWAPGYGISEVASQSSEHLGDHPNLDVMDQSGVSWTTPVRGGSMVVTVKVWTDLDYYENLNVWVDWDGDKVFDADEQVVYDTRLYPTGGSIVSFTVPVPSDAVDSTYLRAALGWVTDPDAVDSWVWGDVEDYELTVSGGPPVPEFGSLAVAVLLTTPAFAYLAARRRS